MNGDAQIAREWAEKVSVHEKITFSVDDETLAAARHILATTTPPTMADVEWDDGVHVGLCAEHSTCGIVRMLEADYAGYILFLYVEEGRTCLRGTHPQNLTPLPGTRLDLTPRREPEPESTPDHPVFLETEEDYENAPEGTIVAQDEGKPFVLIDERWRVENSWVSDHVVLAGTRRRRVLRWGWEA